MSYPTSAYAFFNNIQVRHTFCKYIQHIKPEHGVFGHFSQVTQKIIVIFNIYPKGLKCLCLIWV